MRSGRFTSISQRRHNDVSKLHLLLSRSGIESPCHHRCHHHCHGQHYTPPPTPTHNGVERHPVVGITVESGTRADQIDDWNRYRDHNIMQQKKRKKMLSRKASAYSDLFYCPNSCVQRTISMCAHLKQQVFCPQLRLHVSPVSTFSTHGCARVLAKCNFTEPKRRKRWQESSLYFRGTFRD